MDDLGGKPFGRYVLQGKLRRNGEHPLVPTAPYISVLEYGVYRCRLDCQSNVPKVTIDGPPAVPAGDHPDRPAKPVGHQPRVQDATASNKGALGLKVQSPVAYEEIRPIEGR